MTDTPVLHTQNGLGTGKTNDYSPCFQLPCGRITGWGTVGGSSWMVQKGRNVFFKKGQYFMGTTGDGDVPDRFDPDGRGTSIRVENEGIAGRITRYTVDR